MSDEQAAKAGHCEIVPDLVGEFITPRESTRHVEELRHDFLAAGARLVWIVQAADRIVYAYKADGGMAEFGRNDTLTGDPVLPDFRVVVRDLFELPTSGPVYVPHET